MSGTLERATTLATALDGVSLQDQSPEYALLRLTDAPQTVGLLEIEQGWVSVVVELIPWSQDPDIDVMLGLFAQSWDMGSFRPIVASSGLMLRADMIAGKHFDEVGFTNLIEDTVTVLRQLAQDLTTWPELSLKPPTPGNLRAWMERAPFSARYVGELGVWRVVRDGEDDHPIVVSLSREEHAVSMVYGLDATLDEDLEFLMGLMELNDQFMGSKLVWSDDRALMLMLEIPRAQLTEFGFLAWLQRFEHDVDIARSYLKGRSEDMMTRLQELRALLVAYQRSHKLEDAVIGRRLRRLSQNLEPEPLTDDVHILDEALRQVLDIMFGVIVPMRPRAEALFPMQLELMERGASDVEELLDLMMEYTWLEGA